MMSICTLQVEREGNVLLAFGLVCVAGLAGVSLGKYKLLINKLGYVHMQIDWGYKSIFCSIFSCSDILFICSGLYLYRTGVIGLFWH